MDNEDIYAQLEIAVSQGETETVRRLLEHGTDVKALSDTKSPVNSDMNRRLLKAVAKMIPDQKPNGPTAGWMQSIATLYREPNMNVLCIDKIFTYADQGDSLIIAQHFLTYLAQRIQSPRSTKKKPYHELLFAYCYSKIQALKNQESGSWQTALQGTIQLPGVQKWLNPSKTPCGHQRQEPYEQKLFNDAVRNNYTQRGFATGHCYGLTMEYLRICNKYPDLGPREVQKKFKEKFKQGKTAALQRIMSFQTAQLKDDPSYSKINKARLSTKDKCQNIKQFKPFLTGALNSDNPNNWVAEIGIDSLDTNQGHEMCCGFRDNQYFFWDCNQQEVTLRYSSSALNIVEKRMIAYIKKNYPRLQQCELTYISDIEKPKEIFLNDQQKKLKKAITTYLTEGDPKQLTIIQDVKLSQQAKAIKENFAGKISIDVPEHTLIKATMAAYPDCIVGPKDKTLTQAITHVKCEMLLNTIQGSAKKNTLQKKLELLTTIKNNKSTYCKYVRAKRLSIEDFATNLKQKLANKKRLTLPEPEKELLIATMKAYPDCIVGPKNKTLTQAIAHVRCEILLAKLNKSAQQDALEKKLKLLTIIERYTHDLSADKCHSESYKLLDKLIAEGTSIDNIADTLQEISTGKWYFGTTRRHKLKKAAIQYCQAKEAEIRPSTLTTKMPEKIKVSTKKPGSDRQVSHP